jgi:hypothetical protein
MRLSGVEDVFAILVVALVILIVALVAGWMLVLWLAIWLIIRCPILSILIVVYIALVAWLGPHDAHALASYALIALAVWRLVHKRSFDRLVGQRLGRRSDASSTGSNMI